MRRGREEYSVTAAEWSPERLRGGEDKLGPKQHGGELLKKKGSRLGGSHGRLSGL